MEREPFSLRPAGPEDREFWLAAQPHCRPEQFAEKARGGRAFLICRGRKPLGLMDFVLLWDKLPFLNCLFVLPESRGQGLGTAMLKLAQEAYIRRYGRPEGFELLTGEDNLPARALYGGLGFQPDGELHLFKGLEGAEDDAPLAGR